MARPIQRPKDTNLICNQPSELFHYLRLSPFYHRGLEILGVNDHHYSCKGKNMYVSYTQAQALSKLINKRIEVLFPNGFYDHTKYPDKLDDDPLMAMMSAICADLEIEDVSRRRPDLFRKHCLEAVDEYTFYQACFNVKVDQMTHHQFRAYQLEGKENAVLQNILYLGLDQNKLSADMGRGKRWRSNLNQYQIVSFHEAMAIYKGIRKQSEVSLAMLFPSGFSDQPEFDFDTHLGNICCSFGTANNPSKHYICKDATIKVKNWSEIIDQGYQYHYPVVEALESYARINQIPFDFFVEAL